MVRDAGRKEIRWSLKHEQGPEVERHGYKRYPIRGADVVDEDDPGGKCDIRRRVSHDDHLGAVRVLRRNEYRNAVAELR